MKDQESFLLQNYSTKFEHVSKSKSGIWFLIVYFTTQAHRVCALCFWLFYE